MADTSNPPAPASPKSPLATELCPRCGAARSSGEAHACAAGAARPELSATLTPDSQPPVDSLGATAAPVPAKAPAPAADDLLGTLINDRFEVQKLLGRGGMGAVYQARHRALETKVAIKVLLRPRGAQADNDDHERFLWEAKLASKVRHPNTVYISDFGQLADGRNYLAMEFLKGRPLSDEVDKGPLPLLRALRIAVQIARGLRAVHDCGIAHRDIKPANVLLVEQDGNPDFVKIVDFGIAKVLKRSGPALSPLEAARASAPQVENLERSGDNSADAKSLTLPGTVMGTPAYMSPEQIKGEHVDARTDQYAFGCMLYQMLTGKIPYVGKTAIEVMLKHSDPQTTPVPPRQLVPPVAISDTLEETLLRLLAKDPEERFAAMAAVEQALERELDLLLIVRGDKRVLTADHVAVLDGKLRGSGLLFGRRRVPLGVLLLGALVLAAAVAAGVYFATRRGEPPRLQPGELRRLRAQAVAELHAALQPASPGPLRLQAALALGQSHDATLSGELVPLLGETDLELRIQAAESLGQLAEPSTGAALLAAFQASPPPLLKVALAGALRQLHEPSGQQHLSEALSSADPVVQFSAALLLCADGAMPQATHLLRRYLQRAQPPEEVQQKILACLAQSGDAEARQRLIERARGIGPERLTAAARLLQLGEETGRWTLRRTARQGGPEALIAARWLSGTAARWLSGSDEQNSVALLARVVGDPSATATARQLAAEGLADSGETFQVRRLAPLLAAPSEPPLRIAAAGAIVRLAAQDPGALSENSLHWAQGALADSSWLLRQQAVAVLGDTPAAAAMPLLAGLTRDADLRIRRSALRALARRSEPAALLALRQSLTDGDASIRHEAVRAFGSLLGSPLQRDNVSGQAAAQGWLRERLAQAPPAEQELIGEILAQRGDPVSRAQLLTLATAADPERRRRYVRSRLVETAALVRALEDPVAAVRLAAAQQLARRGDARAAVVLRGAAQLGGVSGLVAYGLLLRLGVATPGPSDLNQLLSSGELEQRLAAVSALAALPADVALPLLSRAAHDPDPQVRSRAAEVAGHFAAADGAALAAPIWRRLLTDSDAAVRARAQSLLARPGAATEPEPELQATAESAPKSAPALAPPAAPAEAADVSSDADPGVDAAEPGATLILDAEPGLLYQVDHRGWQLTGPQPVRLPVGPHHLSSLSSQLDFIILSEQSLTLPLPASPVERLAKAAAESYGRQDYRKAQRQLDQAISLCAQDHKNAVPCTILSVDLIYRLGQVREQQLELPEAMNEYQRVTTLLHKVKGKAELRARVAEAMARLRPRVCKVVLRQQVHARCIEDIVWVAPGPRTLKVGGRLEQIQASTTTDILVGTCK